MCIFILVDNNDGAYFFVSTIELNKTKIPLKILSSGTQRLAYCRNFLLERARADMPLFDFYLVLDVDVTSSTTFTTDNFLSNFLYPASSWAVMTATQTDRYYDIWALRTWPTMTFDFLQRARQLSSISIAWPWITERLISIHQKPIPRDHPLIEVESAFGGAGIYAARYLSNECVYDGWINHGWWWYREQCEHVAFNRCVRRKAGNGKLFINPQFQNI